MDERRRRGMPREIAERNRRDMSQWMSAADAVCDSAIMTRDLGDYSPCSRRLFPMISAILARGLAGEHSAQHGAPFMIHYLSLIALYSRR